MDLKDALPLLGLFIGGALVGVFGGMKSKMSKSVVELKNQVQGVFIPLETIQTDVGELKSDQRVIKTDLGTVKEDLKETKAEVRKAVNDRREMMLDLAKLQGVDQGRREAEDRYAGQDRGDRG